MHVAGDAHALALHRLLLLQARQTPPQSAMRNQAHDARSCESGGHSVKTEHPGSAPERSRNDERQARALIVPNTLGIASCHMKSVSAAGQSSVGHAPFRSGFHPIRIESVQFMAETNSLRRFE